MDIYEHLARQAEPGCIDDPSLRDALIKEARRAEQLVDDGTIKVSLTRTSVKEKLSGWAKVRADTNKKRMERGLKPVRQSEAQKELEASLKAGELVPVEIVVEGLGQRHVAHEVVRPSQANDRYFYELILEEAFDILRHAGCASVPQHTPERHSIPLNDGVDMTIDESTADELIGRGLIRKIETVHVYDYRCEDYKAIQRVVNARAKLIAA